MEKRDYFRGSKLGIILAGTVLAVCALAGCGVSGERGYTAKLEIYEAESGTLLKTIEDEETLDQFDRQFPVFGDWESESEYSEEEIKDLREKVREAKETYNIEVYKHPAAKFGNKKPKKILTMTLYEDTDITKITVADEAVKSFFLPEESLTFLPEEFLIFYSEMPKEQREFCASLIP